MVPGCNQGEVSDISWQIGAAFVPFSHRGVIHRQRVLRKGLLASIPPRLTAHRSKGRVALVVTRQEAGIHQNPAHLRRAIRHVCSRWFSSWLR
jgi:hypothetical protein